MSRTDFAENWVPFRDPILSTYPELSDADLAEADGSTAVLAQRIAEKRGTDPGETQQALHAFLAGPMPADAYAAPVHDNDAVTDSGSYIADGEDAMADDARFGDDTTADTPVGRDR